MRVPRPGGQHHGGLGPGGSRRHARASAGTWRSNQALSPAIAGVAEIAFQIAPGAGHEGAVLRSAQQRPAGRTPGPGCARRWRPPARGSRPRKASRSRSGPRGQVTVEHRPSRARATRRAGRPAAGACRSQAGWARKRVLEIEQPDPGHALPAPAARAGSGRDSPGGRRPSPRPRRAPRPAPRAASQSATASSSKAGRPTSFGHHSRKVSVATLQGQGVIGQQRPAPPVDRPAPSGGGSACRATCSVDGRFVERRLGRSPSAIRVANRSSPRSSSTARPAATS